MLICLLIPGLTMARAGTHLGANLLYQKEESSYSGGFCVGLLDAEIIGSAREGVWPGVGVGLTLYRADWMGPSHLASWFSPRIILPLYTATSRVIVTETEEYGGCFGLGGLLNRRRVSTYKQPSFYLGAFAEGSAWASTNMAGFSCGQRLAGHYAREARAGLRMVWFPPMGAGCCLTSCMFLPITFLEQILLLTMPWPVFLGTTRKSNERAYTLTLEAGYWHLSAWDRSLADQDRNEIYARLLFGYSRVSRGD